MADSSGRLDSSSNPHAVHADSTFTKGSALNANETRNDQNIQEISGAFTDPERQEDAGKKRKRDDDDEAPPVPQHRKPDTEWSDEDQIEESPSEQSSYEGGRFKSAAAENNALDYSSVLWPEMHAITTRILEEQKQNQSPNMEKILRGTLEDSCKGPCSESVEFYLSLLRSNCPVPSPSLFDDPALQKILERLQQGYHSKVVFAIGSLLVPPVDHLYAMGETGLENLWESVNEPWSESSPPFDYYPTPAHSVGFQHDAFSIRQRILIGQPAFEEGQFNPYRATPELYFPFLFVEPDFESEHGEWRLNGEERNANSAMVAVRAVVELYTNADRAHEIDRQIVAFSIVYDTLSVAIYGHYAEVGEIEKPKSYFRRKIGDYKFATPGTQDRWRSYRFVMALYREWAPMHLRRIRSALDSIIGPSNPKTHSPASRSLNDMRPGSYSESLSGQQETQKMPNLMSAQDGGQIAPRDPERVDDTIGYWCKSQEWPAGHAEASGTTRDAVLTSLSRTHTKIADIWGLKIPELEEDPGETVEDSDSELTHSSHSSDARHRFIRNIRTQDFLNHNSRCSELSKSAEDLVSRLSKTEQQVLPQAADADLEFARIAKRTRWCNFAKMVQDIMPKLVPRVDVLYYAGDDSMECFGESVDEPWRTCLSIHKSYRPRGKDNFHPPKWLFSTPPPPPPKLGIVLRTS
ncbi:hypothetical protein IWZ00DRAFT_512233, partial [Phyllosticta capitalensis]